MGNDKNRSILRKLPLFIGLAGGIGGVLPDLDHGYRLILNPEYSAYYLHHYGWVAIAILVTGNLIALGSRQAAALVLRVINADPFRRKEGNYGDGALILTGDEFPGYAGEPDAPMPATRLGNRAAEKSPVRCPLGLDCYHSCAWWQNGKCIFPGEVEAKPAGHPAE